MTRDIEKGEKLRAEAKKYIYPYAGKPKSIELKPFKISLKDSSKSVLASKK